MANLEVATKVLLKQIALKSDAIEERVTKI
jgi:hypothetical protein